MAVLQVADVDDGCAVCEHNSNHGPAGCEAEIDSGQLCSCTTKVVNKNAPNLVLYLEPDSLERLRILMEEDSGSATNLISALILAEHESRHLIELKDPPEDYPDSYVYTRCDRSTCPLEINLLAYPNAAI